MTFPSVVNDYYLDRIFDQEELVDMVVQFFDIDRSEVAIEWEPWTEPRLVCQVEIQYGEFPTWLRISPIDVSLCSHILDHQHLVFAGRIAEFLQCRVLTMSLYDEDFGYAYMRVLVSGVKDYQLVFAEPIAEEGDKAGDKILYYGDKFSDINDAPVKHLEKLLNNRPFRYYASLPSTNEYAMDWLRDGAQSGSVVLANHQQQGRGRKGRIWFTPAGVALAVSVILKPPTDYAHRITMIGALAVYDLCALVGVQSLGIKWANDVQINGKKVAGILPEAAWENGELLGVVLGMGVNVRVKFEDELALTATSIENEIDQSLDRLELVATLLERVDYWMARIDTDEVFNTWKALLNTIGRQVEVDGIVGQAQDVDASGALLIKVADGSIKRVMAGDVSLVTPQNKGQQ